MIKVAVFENEFVNIKTSFDGFNLIYCNSKLEFTPFVSSQAIGDLSRIGNYDVVIVDIDLSSTSNMDGYQILEIINTLNIPNTKVMILTGHISIKDKLKELNLPFYPIITKPINMSTIKAAFDHYNLI